MGVGVILSTVLAVQQFLAQNSQGGLWYFLGERDFSVTTPGIAHLLSFGRILLRPYATFSHPNEFGGYLLMVTTLFIFSPSIHNKIGVNTKSQLDFVFRQTVIVAGSLGVWLSFSRTAWVIYLLVLAAYFYFRTKKPTIIVALLVIGIFIVVEEAGIGRLRALFTTDQISTNERVALIQSALRMWYAFPIFGVGPLHFIGKLPMFSPPPYLLQPVHSIYLLMLAETGLVGLGIFLAVIYRALRYAWNRRPGVRMAVLVALGLGTTDHYLLTLTQTQLLFALVLALAFLPRSRYN